MRAFLQISRAIAAAFVMATTGSIACAADGDAWTVSKFSGEVWLGGSGVQQASLRQEDVLKPGDTVRTGRNGRVLLKRGEEMIMVAPNSVIGVPAQQKEGLSTTILQRAGSILLDVEKRNVKHFEVETPYLAAVVKGTQFRVTVNAGKTTVDVIRGQVEVSDFKSGQIAQVMAGQHATAFANGKAGLSLGGTGTFSPIEQGKPRATSIERVPVPRNGLVAPRHAAGGQSARPVRHTLAHPVGHGAIRISSSIGEVRLNLHRVTHGLARDKSAVHGASQNAARNNTLWSSSEGGANSANNSQDNSGNDAANAAGISAAIAASSGSQGGGNGNGNSGNGNGNGGANGNGHAYGHGNGNGNGNGNGRGRS